MASPTENDHCCVKHECEFFADEDGWTAEGAFIASNYTHCRNQEVLSYKPA